MKKTLLPALMLFCMMLSCYTSINAQAIRPVDLVKGAIARQKNFEPLRISASAEAAGKYAGKLREQVNDYMLFNFNRAQSFAAKSVGALELELPSVKGGITLQLVPVNIYADGFSVKTSSGEKVMSTGWFYQGIIKGDEKSVAAISIFEDEIGGFISSAEGNYVIGKLRNTGGKEPVNILYNESALTAKPAFGCSTPDIALPAPPPNDMALTSRSVRIYYETEVDYYTAFGNNATSVTNYVTNLFNQNKTLYNNDGICVSLSQVFVWTTTDPYSGTSSATLLSQFQATRTSFNGDVGQLITTRTIGGGQAAVIYGLCSSSVANRLCVSGDMSTSFPNVPTYSWSVMVTTHEMGHLMGSRHTHACVWNGNNTAIDGCAGFVEGSCSLPGNPAGGGTIMSYCHLQSVGINFSNGFGPQPGAQIRNSIDASTCLGSCATEVPCAAAVSGLASSNITTTSATVSWNAMTGANGYIVEYKPSSSSTWTVLPQTAFTTASLTSLASGTAYDWRVKAVCNCDVNSPYATASFSTLIVCGTPGSLSSSNISATGATVSWSAVSGATNYSVDYRVSGAGSWTSAGTVTTTSATLTGLLSSTTYEWQVRANCPGNSGPYASSTFTTLVGQCGIPTGMVAEPDGCAGVTYLYWSAVPNATSYVIEIKLSSATTWTVYETAWPYTSYEAYGNGNYNWRMKANCATGTSDYSVVVNYFCRYIPRICDGGGPIPRTNPHGVKLNVNPQPATGAVNISFAWNKQATGLLLITNQYGKVALRKNVSLQKGNNNIYADVSGITPGVYTIRLLSGGRSATQKLVIGN